MTFYYTVKGLEVIATCLLRGIWKIKNENQGVHMNNVVHELRHMQNSLVFDTMNDFIKKGPKTVSGK